MGYRIADEHIPTIIEARRVIEYLRAEYSADSRSWSAESPYGLAICEDSEGLCLCACDSDWYVLEFCPTMSVGAAKVDAGRRWPNLHGYWAAPPA